MIIVWNLYIPELYVPSGLSMTICLCDFCDYEWFPFTLVKF
jgi:hypothetical protein